MASSLRIGEVARRSGLPVKTIRFYSDEGLLQPSGRSPGGYRLFDEAVLDDLSWIRTLKALEIPLDDVGQILAARRSGVCTCERLKATLAARLAEIEGRIGDLRALRGELSGLLESWQACGGRRPAVRGAPGRSRPG